MTYFLMLLFVFVTLAIISSWILSPKLWWHYYGSKHLKKRVVFVVVYALLGTFFFHNIW
jgi:hypothetical protein